MEQDIDSRSATLQRKRPHDLVSRHDASNAGSASSTPRKRAKQAGKLGHQDVRDFVPVGASFSTSAVSVDEAQDSGDDGSRIELSPKAEEWSHLGVLKVSDSGITEQEKALVEGRRLFIHDLHPDTTEKDLKDFFKGYSIENIRLPGPMGDDTQLVMIEKEESLSLDCDSPMGDVPKGTITTSANDGRRLYVGNLPFAATVEDLEEFFRGFSLQDVTIPVNPRKRRPVGYAFVTVSTSDEADRAIFQLPGNKILERKISVQRARAEETKDQDLGTTAAEEEESTMKSRRMEDYRGNQGVKEEKEIEEDNTRGEITEIMSPLDVQAAPPVKWNAVNTTKIRTTLGGSVGKVKASIDEPSLANGDQKSAEDARYLATSVALERVEGLRIRLSTMDPHDGPVSAYKSAQQELHDAEVDYNYCLYFPCDEEFQPPPLSTARKLTPKGKNSRERRERMWNMIKQCMKEGALQDFKEGKIRVSSAERLGQPSPSQNSDSERSHPYASDSGAASNSDTESNNSGMDSEGQSEDGDAMMQYSSSVQLAADEAERNKTTFAALPSHKACILADLSPHDFNAQLRYFHTTKAREEVDGRTPVRCLVCAKEGHMAGLCEFLTCSTCGAFNQHVTQACPGNAKCGKCREQGHDEGHCPYKLKRMPGYEIVCDLCQRNGHIEEDCELIWRTSGRPWESNLAHAKIRLSCYECGRSGHLGNDCPSRRPNKSIGTSTWDGNMGLISIESTREIKIKGKATQQDPINLDDSDDDRAKFFGPKISVPEPVRKGQIRIVTGRRESPVYEPTRVDRQVYADHRHDSFTPVNESYRNDGARQPYDPFRDGGSGNWRAGDGPDYATGHNDLRYNNYRPSERRSRSPPYRDHGGYSGSLSWPPPQPAPRGEHQDRRPPADVNFYRPMPSAAQNAWTKRRV